LALCAPAAARAQGWVTAYYTGWRQDRLAPERIDYDAITHLVHFALVPRADGTLDPAPNGLTPANVASAVTAAHAAGRKILFTVGGRNSRAGFEGAMSRKNRDVFVAALLRFLDEHGYDGIDVDMEEITRANEADYASFIDELRGRLDTITPRPLLTAAALWEPELFARLADRFDQINIMTYNLSGPYPGWISWHNGPLYDGNRRFPNRAGGLPSVDGLVKAFVAAGVPRGKLGIGMSFNASVWTGGDISGPGQSWKTPPRVKNLPYYAVADAYKISEYDYANPTYHWDAEAQAPYLSIPGENGGEGQFVSYANEVTAEKMAAYARSQKLGGMFLWDLGAGYRAELPEGKRDLLLQAVKKARYGADARP
jgi:chitinase